MKPLSGRQQSILNRIVETHIDTAEPVGSKCITDLYRGLYQDSYSPATVRHEMGSLEDMGYLTHPHTSAGRVPTDLGYRYYVDHSLRAETLSHELMARVQGDLLKSGEEGIEGLADKASRILAKLAGEVSVFAYCEGPARGARKRWQVTVQGSSTMLEKPEFQDLGIVRALLKAFEEKMEFADWLVARTSASDVSVTIGGENGTAPFKHCSIVSTRCSIEGEGEGTLAVLGPRRMRYSRAVPLVTHMAGLVKTALQRPRSGRSLNES